MKFRAEYEKNQWKVQEATVHEISVKKLESNQAKLCLSIELSVMNKQECVTFKWHNVHVHGSQSCWRTRYLDEGFAARADVVLMLSFCHRKLSLFYVNMMAIILSVVLIGLLSNVWRMHVVSLVNQTLPSPALDVFHHQHGEGRVWPLLHGLLGQYRNVDMTNEISAVTCKFNYDMTQCNSRVHRALSCESFAMRVGD